MVNKSLPDLLNVVKFNYRKKHLHEQFKRGLTLLSLAKWSSIEAFCQATQRIQTRLSITSRHRSRAGPHVHEKYEQNPPVQKEEVKRRQSACRATGPQDPCTSKEERVHLSHKSHQWTSSRGLIENCVRVSAHKEVLIFWTVWFA